MLLNRLASPLLVLALLSALGCSTGGWPGGRDAWGWNPQAYQGCTVGQVRQYDFAPGAAERDHGAVGGPETQLTVSATWWDCKDKDRVDATVDAGSLGRFDYEAEDVTGRDRAAVRAGVEKAANDAGVELTTEAVGAIVDSIMPLLGAP